MCTMRSKFIGREREDRASKQHQAVTCYEFVTGCKITVKLNHIYNSYVTLTERGVRERLHYHLGSNSGEIFEP